MARTLLITIPGWIVVVLIIGRPWVAIPAAVMIGAGVADLIYLSISIRRRERAGES